ncbi:hypothetical protein CQ018_01480 [Arthrobacter sp. MYb227]|uniref:DUF3090 domain-containing protein n=1 Tax=Arthrobacter sp. MYb227 TaxID=1848601 RepID=UPI000CFBE0F6|nr:DUF3090 domain-containing protein [Arthrobacter sp. MYb227]PQZ95985.1 hypothetical protein CQ018_01480 [Arthrobacter sp. MYb227]
MPTRIHEFAWPDRVVVGTIGLPGARTFYLQVRAGAQLVSIVMEKQQSAVLAEKIDEILDELMSVEGNRFSVPSSTPVELVDNDPLEAVQEQFRTGAMSLGWDPSTAQIVIEAYPLPAEDPDDTNEGPHEERTDEPEMLRVLMPVGTARAFTMRTFEIVSAGRPICPLCGYPIDPDGHTCTLPEA